MTLISPDGNLEVSVVIPAKNEEERIGACLSAFVDQVGVDHSRYEVLLVLDGCSDATEKVAERFGDVLSEGILSGGAGSMRLHILKGPDLGVGRARKLGMDIAYSRLLSVGRPRGLIASTDADSRVDAGWILSQLKLVEAGAEAIGGRIFLENGGLELPQEVREWHEEQGTLRYRNLISRDPESMQDHWQFSGASMSLTAEVYDGIGGLDPVQCLEDEALERHLEANGTRIVRSSSVKVVTSSRTNGRAEQGLAFDLAKASRDLPSGDLSKSNS